MKSSAAITALTALGHDSRLALFRLLVRAGAEGMTAGDIADRLAIPPSTLSHHLGKLERAGLIGFVRRERNLIYALDIAGTRSLIAFLIDDCCHGAPELCGMATARLPVAEAAA